MNYFLSDIMYTTIIEFVKTHNGVLFEEIVNKVQKDFNKTPTQIFEAVKKCCLKGSIEHYEEPAFPSGRHVFYPPSSFSKRTRLPKESSLKKLLQVVLQGVKLIEGKHEDKYAPKEELIDLFKDIFSANVIEKCLTFLEQQGVIYYPRDGWIKTTI